VAITKTMEIGQIQCRPLTSDRNKQIFLKLMENKSGLQKFEDFKALLKCRRVSRQWKNDADATYNIFLSKDQQEIDNRIEERNKERNYKPLKKLHSKWHKEIFKHRKNKTITEQDVIAWFGKRDQITYALLYDCMIWYHNHLKTKTVKDMEIENLFGEGHNPLVSSITNLSIATAYFILKATNVDIENGEPLKEAIQNGLTDIAKELIERGAQLDYQKFNTWIPEHNCKSYCTKFNALKMAQEMDNKELVEFIEEFKKKSKKRAIETNEIVTNNKKQK
jgi:hypothetical protein